MVKRRAADASFDPDQVTCHTVRGTGITTYLENGGELEPPPHRGAQPRYDDEALRPAAAERGAGRDLADSDLSKDTTR